MILKLVRRGGKYLTVGGKYVTNPECCCVVECEPCDVIVFITVNSYIDPTRTIEWVFHDENGGLYNEVACPPITRVTVIRHPEDTVLCDENEAILSCSDHSADNATGYTIEVTTACGVYTHLVDPDCCDLDIEITQNSHDPHRHVEWIVHYDSSSCPHISRTRVIRNHDSEVICDVNDVIQACSDTSAMDNPEFTYTIEFTTACDVYEFFVGPSPH